MPSENVKRLAPLTGALFVVLTILSFIIEGEPPGADEGAAEVAEFYIDNEGKTFAAAIIASLAALALVFFAATVRRTLRRGEQGPGIFPAAAFGGGVVAAAGIGVDSALRFTLAEQADDVDPGVILTLHTFWEGFFFPMVIGLSALLLAVSLAALGTRVIPAWLAWIGIVIAIVFFTPAGFVAFLLSGLWIIVLSVLLWRQEPAAAATGVA